MTQNDAELIQRSLQGDQDAFAALVNKYQKPVHALAWRKIGDFHIAQEITQDAFLKAYQNLENLKSYNSFGGWLYVIAARLCYDWRQKNAMPMESMDNIDASEVDHVSYSRYVADKQATEADETRREVVKKLLQKLPESERTVITLFYLGEMTINAISEFLGVSPNTIKSRLSRARNRLKKEEDMIRQNLGSFQLPANLTENIMREVSRIVPATPAANKPVLPWALSAASAVLIFLLMGVGTQYLSRFQKPYNLNATSEPTVEIIEAAFVLNVPAKPDVRNQAGNSATPGKRQESGQKPDAQRFAAAPVNETEVSTPTPQWARTKGPEGGIVNNLFTTNSGDMYAGTPTSLYKLAANSRTWRLVSTSGASSLSLQDWITGRMQMVARGNMLYFATDTEVLVSANEGETWNSLGDHPKGLPRGLVVTDAGFYLAFMEDIYFSKDGRASWVSVKNDLAAEKIRGLVAVENTVFVGTDTGLYRLNAETWEQLTVGPVDLHGEKPVIHALAASKHRLYVAAGREMMPTRFGKQAKSIQTTDTWWALYRSTDFGDTWYAIDPRKKMENETELENGVTITQFSFSTTSDLPYLNTEIIANEGKVVLADSRELFYSVNAGETWTAVGIKNKSAADNLTPPLVMLDADTFYIGTPSGIQRTTDGGESWQPFNTGFVSTPVMILIAVKGKLYASSIDRYVTSVDGGESWAPLPRDVDHGVFIAAFDDNVYVKRGNNMNSRSPLLRLSTEDNSLKFIPGMPSFGRDNLQNKVQTEIDVPEEIMTKVLLEILQEAFPNKGKPNLEDLDPEQAEMLKGIDSDQITEKLKEHVDLEQLRNEALNKAFQEKPTAGMMSVFGDFAVSDDTYYVEYKQRLFRWKPGMTEWHDTGLVDETELAFPVDYFAKAAVSLDALVSMGFKIVVSGKTVYVGKRDGRLSQSFDEGDTWNDVTDNLPFSFIEFNAIAFAGSTVYVATDKGVAYSNDGTHWRAATDVEGGQLVMERLVAEGTTVYGTTGQYVYQLNENASVWKQVTPEIPDSVLSFAVDGNVLYVGTANSGVLRFTLDE